MSYSCADAVGDISAALMNAGVPMVGPESDGHAIAEVSLLAEQCIGLYPLVRKFLARELQGDIARAAFAAKVAEIDEAAAKLAKEYD